MNNFIVENEDDINKRVDKFIDENVLDLSRSFIQELILEGKVLVNDKVCKSSYKIRLNDKISLLQYEIKKLDVESQDLDLDVVYEDKDLIIINKPQGMVVHPGPNLYRDTLVNGLLFYCKDLSSINGVERPGIVHRIDKDTSGIIVIAKNNYSHNFLSEQFKEHSIKRQYVALVNGALKKPSAILEYNLGRNPNNRLKMMVVESGKKAITEYKVLKNYLRYSLVLCTLRTGRTHQIRVHFSHIGHSIVGDPVYGKKNNLYNNGQLLHARTLGFIHPTSKKYIEFRCPLPEHFAKVVKLL